MALVPLLGKPGTRDIPGGKLPSEGDFLQLLHGEIEARGGNVGSRAVKDLCCKIKANAKEGKRQRVGVAKHLGWMEFTAWQGASLALWQN